METFGSHFSINKLSTIKGSRKRILSSLLIVLLLPSCQFILRSTFGIKKHVRINEIEVISTSEEYFDDYSSIGYFDSNSAVHLFTHDEVTAKKYIFQPLNFLMFDSIGTWIGSVANCDAKVSFGKMNWTHMLSKFPIKNTFTDSALNLSDFKKAFHLIKHGDLKPINKYSVFIIWSKFMGRQNRIFLSQMSNYAKEHGFEIYLVNSDLVWANRVGYTDKRI